MMTQNNLIIMGAIIVILFISLWYINKQLFKALATKMVIEAEEYFGSNSGKSKLAWVKTSILTYAQSKNKLLRMLLGFILTDKYIERLVIWSLSELKDVLEYREVKNVKNVCMVKEAVSDLGRSLLGAEVLGDKNLASNEQITLEMSRIQEKIDTGGYAKVFAKYNNTDKFSAGAEAGIKF